MRRIGLGALLASVLFVPLLISAGNPLRQRVEALEAESDSRLVVRDENRLEVGEVLDLAGGTVAIVPLSAPGLPSGKLLITRDTARGESNTVELLFVDSDCVGTSFLPTLTRIPVVDALYAPSFAFNDGSAAFLGTTVEHPGFETTFLSKMIDSTHVCINEPRTTVAVPAEQVPGWDFTPPFEVVTRGDLLQ
jgi:hypothetical protein